MYGRKFAAFQFVAFPVFYCVAGLWWTDWIFAGI